MAKKAGRKGKHIPQRTCIGCGQVLAKRSLIRLVRSPDGVLVDSTGRLPGRGTYLHSLRSCWEKGLKGKLAHALKVELSAEDRERLMEVMLSLPEEGSEEQVASESS